MSEFHDPDRDPQAELARELAEDEEALGEFETRSITGALWRYRILAWIVGTLLIVLVCVAMPLKYFGPHNGRLVTLTAIPHGWLFMVLIITIYDLGRRVRWSLGHMLLLIVSGLVPFMTFVVEHFATKEVRRFIADVDAGVVTFD